jgi:broad specificity phosphatase PhoE
MNIGLIRHFKVDCDKILFMTSDEFEALVRKYDEDDIIENDIDLGNIKWNKCFSSDLYRAVKTAESIFKEEIRKTHLLREVPISPIFKSNAKLPYIFWAISGRCAWFFGNKSQKESRKDTEKRIDEFLSNIDLDSNENILIVCHGFFMNTLQKKLKNRGFKGKVIKRPKNGTLYLYTK